jgi:distribution and morphology protein 10
VGKYSTETLYSTDSALVGIRGLYNFGPDPRSPESPSATEDTLKPERYGRLSAGGELYYGLANKSGGVSTGLRFTTLPQHTGFPMTMTAILNPLMGNLSASYAVKAGRDLSMATRFDFNVFSYESGVVLGCELWRRTRNEDGGVIKTIPKATEPSPMADEDVQGVLKARIDQSGSVGLLWEGRIKDLLFSLGKVDSY